ncbi:Ni,Fe-hydrogenase III small subunit [Thiocapsa roseopersicina]|uniref:Ni,Fe-hydrogenase III small subunit n=2 Tax=Thiocapsa roseopersicina TaxID=1058 RepID=A0A1H2W895_THIRO|nr:Ni,Fe-hydrogenase III small subunit [Thiocapsa roseopersicina]
MLFSEPRQAEGSWVSSPSRLAITLPYYYETRFSMFRILKQSLRTGVVTEAAPSHNDAELERLGIEVRRHIDARFGGSLAIRQVDAGSCNGCELEIHALNNPFYDVERFGIHFVASPRHADVLLVTGPVSRHMETALRRTWRATPSPKFVIAAGSCACDGGEIGVSYASCGTIENVIPVDVKIPGCPPSPVDLLKGLLGALEIDR